MATQDTRSRLRRWSRRALAAMMLGVLLLGLGAGVRLALLLNEPFPGVALTWRKDLKLYTVSWMTPPGWPGLADGLQTNDRILCVDGYQPLTATGTYGLDPVYSATPCPLGTKAMYEIFRERAGSTDPPVAFRVDRGGQIVEVPGVRLVNFDLPMLIETFLPPFLLGAGLLALARIVYYRVDAETETNLVFALLAVLCASVTLGLAYNFTLSEHLSDTSIATMFLVVPAASLAGATFFHLIGLMVAQGTLSTWARRLLPLYYVSGGIALAVGVFIFTVRNDALTVPFDRPFAVYAAVSVSVSLVWGLGAFARTFLKSTSRRARHQSALMFAGIVIALLCVQPYVGMFFLNQPAPAVVQIIPYIGFGYVALVAYTILRYQLFASRSQMLTILVVGAFCILIATIVDLVAGQRTDFLPILGAAAATALGLAVRWRFFSFFDPLLRREKLDVKAVVRFSRDVGRLQTINELLAATGRAFLEEMDVEHIEVWLFDAEGQVLQHYAAGLASRSVAVSAVWREQLAAQPGPVRAGTPAAANYSPLQARTEVGPVCVWSPLIDRGRAAGVLALGPRWTGAVFDNQDLQLIGVMAHELALAILNTRQIERLQAMTGLVLQAEENERRKIARELHDTILQFLPALTYGLDSLKDHPDRVDSEIERWQDRITAEAARLRRLLTYLRAPEVLVQRGLVPSLEDWVTQARQETVMHIETEFSTGLEAALSIDAKIAIYRVLREAIHNALKHSQGHQVVARLARDGTRVCFSVEDDGHGFEPARAQRAGEKGYSSLQDLRVYAESVGGRLEILSAPGTGTVIRGEVPVVQT